MVDDVQKNPVTSLDPSSINESHNTVISDTSVHPQVKINDSPFTSVVIEILERDRASSPYTPHQIEKDLREYIRVLTRVSSQQTGIPPIDFNLPHRNRNNA